MPTGVAGWAFVQEWGDGDMPFAGCRSWVITYIIKIDYVTQHAAVEFPKFGREPQSSLDSFLMTNAQPWLIQGKMSRNVTRLDHLTIDPKFSCSPGTRQHTPIHGCPDLCAHEWCVD